MTSLLIKNLIPGSCEGTVYVLEPFSFWGGVDVITGKLKQKKHPNQGLDLKDKIIAVNNFIGSSSSASVLLELIRKKLSPRAILMQEVDAIVCLASIVAENLNYHPVPMFQISNPSALHLRKISINASRLEIIN